ncbi:DUF305 domain-containing protein [Arthrobacter sp. CAU 1506]|uniref:DUF305 domain-containing protein n=1 Tax=Arthrobacter sp. CAU 1506 TaxID=2560052 RepID=UPI0010AC563C|nr:DUF305 domain-containing protein [Arthrobacter sp. CAU 1506]TJY71395.1 DUF305 domain-containing protein [Arthrobacter sp. CAU 1506]
MKRQLTVSAAALATVLALAGCATGESGTQSPEQTSAATSATSAAEVSAEHNDADTMFAQMMIPHHQQAVQMSEIMLSKEDLDPKITDLATKIKEAQGPEIERMTGMLQAWGQPSMMPSQSAGMDGHELPGMASEEAGMEGMMSEEDLAQLEAAQSTEAAKLFLTQMIAHHEGAVKMAEQEMEQGSNPQAVELARTIVTDQEGEITEMRDLLKAL